MNNMLAALDKKVQESMLNNFGKENYDEYRFGKYTPPQIGLLRRIKNLLVRPKQAKFDVAKHSLITKYGDRLSLFYDNVDDNSKQLIIDLLAYRILGYTKVKLPLSNKDYWKLFEKVKPLLNENDTINPKFLHFLLKRGKLNSIGYNIDFYFTEAGIVTDFILEQYAYKHKNEYVVVAEKGDVVLDIGGCWGDTALYFADKVSDTGKVYSFEFIPGNIELHNMNTSLNPHLKKQIALIENPVSDISNQEIYYRDNGPASRLSLTPFDGQTGLTQTISIDDFVAKNNIEKIDFIKMDIEGAEPMALRGAINTIKTFKPKLAIAIYHSMDDFVNIPEWILSLGLGYKLHVGHYKIHAEETILFAIQS